MKINYTCIQCFSTRLLKSLIEYILRLDNNCCFNYEDITWLHAIGVVTVSYINYAERSQT